MKKITGNMHILCADRQEYFKLMEILKNNGYRWSSGCSLTEFDAIAEIGNYIPHGIIINTYNDETITYRSEDISKLDYNITFKEFMGDNKMTKADLKDGMIVKTRNGNAYIYFSRYNRFVRDETWNGIDAYTDDLRNKHVEEYDIVAIYDYELGSLNDIKTVIEYRTPIWEREELVEMTIAEIEEKLGIKNLKVVKES